MVWLRFAQHDEHAELETRLTIDHHVTAVELVHLLALAHDPGLVMPTLGPCELAVHDRQRVSEHAAVVLAELGRSAFDHEVDNDDWRRAAKTLIGILPAERSLEIAEAALDRAMDRAVATAASTLGIGPLCPHCGSDDMEPGATGLDRCKGCDGLSRGGLRLGEGDGPDPDDVVPTTPDPEPEGTP